MIVGFNHNVTYRGTEFHVQTEDSGPKKPHLVTLLYHGGIIISSQKTVYADIIKVDHLEQVVEDLAKEQHKGMLKRLTRGEFDARIVELGIPLTAVAASATTVPLPERPAEKTPAGAVETEVVEAPVAIVEEPVVDKFRRPKPEEMSLEELVYAYLTAGRDSQ